ncbi:MAG: RNA polymerase factor sigma-54 [Oscillospiraceae bacterium]|nr:RNA polymerase factor sigma-54 [Oscillospiraceae bacterium]
MKLEFHLKQTQHLSPRLIQYMRILSMNTQELYQHVLEIQQENPVLEFEEGGEGSGDKLRWLVSMNSTPRSAVRIHDEEADRSEREEYADTSDCFAETLFAHLRSQILKADCPEAVRAKAILLASSVNDSGYLEGAMPDFEADAEARAALRLLQSCDPAGVGARSLSECITLQLDRLGTDTALARSIAQNYLDAVASSSYQHIATALGVTKREIFAAVKQIRSADCRPGCDYAPQEPPVYVYPDVIVDQHLNIKTNDGLMPSLYISPYYRSLAGSDDPELQRYLNDKLEQAANLLKSIDQRRETLILCVQTILRLQKDFFSSPAGVLKPMTLEDVAEQMGVRASTVSRACKNKYLQSAYGMYAMSSLFTVSLPADGGQAVSSRVVKAAIAELIAAEDPNAPLSDHKIQALCAARGIQVSRRTIAKYRSALGLPSAAGRRANAKIDAAD